MPNTLPPLEELRRAIDAVDDGLLELVVRRGALVAEVGRGKSAGDAPIYRPAREAQIMRRLLARHKEADEKGRILRIWRAIMAASYERQGGLRIAADPAVEWEAVGHFCPRSRPASASAAEALGRVLAGGADLAVVPAPTPFGGAAWLPALIDARQQGAPVFVLSRLPFFALPDAPFSETLVIGRGIVDPSGDDVSLSAGVVAPAGAVTACYEIGSKTLSLFAHAEYVRPDDSRLGAAGAVWLGAYPRPLDPSGPRAVEFALRP
jgi:chorismate mutase